MKKLLLIFSILFISIASYAYVDRVSVYSNGDFEADTSIMSVNTSSISYFVEVVGSGLSQVNVTFSDGSWANRSAYAGESETGTIRKPGARIIQIRIEAVCSGARTSAIAEWSW